MDNIKEELAQMVEAIKAKVDWKQEDHVEVLTLMGNLKRGILGLKLDPETYVETIE